VAQVLGLFHDAEAAELVPAVGHELGHFDQVVDVALR